MDYKGLKEKWNPLEWKIIIRSLNLSNKKLKTF